MITTPISDRQPGFFERLFHRSESRPGAAPHEQQIMICDKCKNSIKPRQTYARIITSPPGKTHTDVLDLCLECMYDFVNWAAERSNAREEAASR
jgi:hypothetical protein